MDVVRVGNDLTMPSPFKEREKRKTEGSGYRDLKRRLWVTVVDDGGFPVLRWRCWWTKGAGGKAYGGRTPYALSVLTKVPQEEIAKVIGLAWDAEVAKAETFEDQVAALLSAPERKRKAANEGAERRKVARAGLLPHDQPTSCVPLWSGTVITTWAESMVSGRGIEPEIGRDYRLAWDIDREAVMIPWIGPDGQFLMPQWWDGKKYRSPYDVRDRLTRGDAIMGLHRWKAGNPLILCEGPFTAMSVGGCCIGGSEVQDAQVTIIKSANPGLVLIAFDNDGAGLSGTEGWLQRLRREGIRCAAVFPPDRLNDWNDVLRKLGLQGTVSAFIERTRESMAIGEMGHVSQYSGGRR